MRVSSSGTPASPINPNSLTHIERIDQAGSAVVAQPHDTAELLCPSAQPDMPHSVIFGVVGGTVDHPSVFYLSDPQPVTDRLLDLSGPVKPTELFRFAAPCAATRCQQYDGATCQLVDRLVQLVPTATDRLPRCRLRPRCRWGMSRGGQPACGAPSSSLRTTRQLTQIRAAADPSAQRQLTQLAVSGRAE